MGICGIDVPAAQGTELLLRMRCSSAVKSKRLGLVVPRSSGF
jgi:hypothetical protein